jgi:endonuclease/exonuclease/phosphatase family metal-dependent hydrolase
MRKLSRVSRWRLVDQVQTHCEWTALYVSNEVEIVSTILDIDAAVAAVAILDGVKTLIASAHLAPFKENGQLRIQQLAQIMSMVESDQCVIIAGDLNIRQDEATRFLRSQPSLKDASTVMPGALKDKATWDSFVNKYHSESFEFRSCFDRVFLSKSWDIADYRLVGKSKFGGTFLSDHFGICTTVKPS